MDRGSNYGGFVSFLIAIALAFRQKPPFTISVSLCLAVSLSIWQVYGVNYYQKPNG